MIEKGYNTNLASEYYILSMLYRIGAKASITIGNKKSVDIMIEKGDKLLTIDVKGLRDTSCFPIDNWTNKKDNHYLVFVSYLNGINKPTIVPEVYIVPANELEKKYDELDGDSVIYVNPKGNRKVVQYNRLKKLGKKYLNQWSYFIDR